MTFKKYPLTILEADLVIFALRETVRFVEKNDTYGGIIAKSALELISKLETYNWEVDK